MVQLERRRPVQRRARQRLENILDVTATLVDEHGPDLVTTTMIADQARISVGSVYAYFANRMAIYDAIVARAIVKLRALITDARASLDPSSSTFLDGSCAVIDRLVDLYRTEPGFRTLWISAYLSPAMLAAMRDHDDHEAHQCLRRLAATGERLTVADPLATMKVYVGMLDKGLDLIFRTDPHGDEAIIGELKRAVCNYLSPLLERTRSET